MGKPELIVIGGSAGAVEGLSHLLANCVSATSPPFVIVLHIGKDAVASASAFFQKSCKGFVKDAEPHEPLKPGHVYFAPAGYHLLVSEKREFALDVDEPLHFSRPSIDVLFESAASVYGKETIGVLLSGASADGAEGLRILENAGASILIQSIETSEFKEMPLAAIGKTKSPQVLDVQGICSFLAKALACP